MYSEEQIIITKCRTILLLYLSRCSCFLSVCDDCNREYEGDCPVHGPLVIIKDTEVNIIQIFTE